MPKTTKKDFLQAACAVGVAAPYRQAPDFHNAGCGTFIAEDEVITCWHVLRLANGNEVPRPLILIQNQNGEFSRVKAMIADKNQDVAYLKLASPIGRNFLPCAEGSGVSLTDKFQLLSNFQGKPDLDTEVLKVSASHKLKTEWTREPVSCDVYLTTTDVRKGYSGSAILKNGEVFSVLTVKNINDSEQVWAPSRYGFMRFVKQAREEINRPPEKRSFFARLFSPGG